MTRFLLLIAMFVISSSVFSQDNTHWLVKKMKTADTVLLISHKATAGVLYKDSTGKVSSPPELLIGGKLNDSIVTERKVLTSVEIQTLSRILTQPLQSKNIYVAKCFIPHHSVILIKGGIISYIDICFTCNGYIWSKDLQSLGSFDNYKWRALESFFLKQGFTYELGVSK